MLDGLGETELSIRVNSPPLATKSWVKVTDDVQFSMRKTINALQIKQRRSRSRASKVYIIDT